MAKCAYIILSLGWLYCPTGNFGHLQPHYELSNPKEWQASNFSLQYHPQITHSGCENKGKDHQLKKLWIIKQILLLGNLGNV